MSCLLILYFDLVVIGRWTTFFVPALLLSMLTHVFLSSSLSLPYFILAVPMRECVGKHSCMTSSFPIAILNGTCLFREAKIVFALVYAYQNLIKLHWNNNNNETNHIVFLCSSIVIANFLLAQNVMYFWTVVQITDNHAYGLTFLISTSLAHPEDLY